MTQTSKRKKNLIVIMALVLVCAVSVVGTLAYLTQKADPVTNTFVAAGGGVIIDPDPDPDPDTGEDVNPNFYLLETPATYADGKYTLNTGAQLVLNNLYDKVVPNMTIPKDPKLTLNVATGADVYLYVKVTDTTANNLTCNLSADWTQVNGLTLQANETVYCYKNDVLTGIDGKELDAVGILANDQVAAAAALSDTDMGTDGMQLGQLKFEAYLCQAGGFSSAAEAYTACFPA